MAEQHVAERARRHADGARNFARVAAAIRYVAEHFDEQPPLATVRIPSGRLATYGGLARDGAAANADDV